MTTAQPLPFVQTYQTRQRGFTLVEVMVALAIFAIAALVFLKNATLMVQQQQRLEEKTLALWLAENRLAELRLSQPWPPIGSTETEVTSAQREWRISTEVSETALPTLRKVLVTVRQPAADEDRILASLTGFMGEH